MALSCTVGILIYLSLSTPSSGPNPLLTSLVAPIIVSLIVGVVLGRLGPRFFQKRKIVEYQTYSMPLLRFKRDIITLTVPASRMAGVDPNDQTPLGIDNVYGFEVRFANIGHEGVQNPELMIALDPSATILDYDTMPGSSSARTVTIQRDPQNLNILRVTPQYISQGETILVSMVSTGNKDRTCKVKVTGLDVRDRESRQRVLSNMIPMFLVLVLIYIGALVPAIMPKRALAAFGFGFKTETTTTTVAPLWIIVLFIFLLVTVGFYFVRGMINFIVTEMRRDKSWDAPLELDEPWLIRLIRSRVQ